MAWQIEEQKTIEIGFRIYRTKQGFSLQGKTFKACSYDRIELLGTPVTNPYIVVVEDFRCEPGCPVETQIGNSVSFKRLNTGPTSKYFSMSTHGSEPNSVFSAYSLHLRWPWHLCVTTLIEELEWHPVLLSLPYLIHTRLVCRPYDALIISIS